MRSYYSVKWWILLLCLPTLLMAKLPPFSTQAQIISPVNGELCSATVSVRVELQCKEDVTWELKDTHLESQLVSIIAQGSGPVHSDQEFLIDSPAFGTHTLSFEVDAEMLIVAEQSFTASPEPLNGWKHTPQRLGQRYLQRPSTASSFGLLRFEIAPKTPELPGQLWLDCHLADGESRLGWPIDLSSYGLEISASLLPLVFSDSVVLAGSGQVLCFSDDGSLRSNLTVDASQMSAPILWHNEAGQPRILLTKNHQGQTDLLILNEDLVLIEEIDLPFGSQVPHQLPLSVDLDGDGHREILLLLKNGELTSLLRLSGTDLLPEVLHTFSLRNPRLVAGEIDGDGRSDLLLSDDSGFLAAIDQEGVKWQIAQAGQHYSTLVLHDMDNDFQQEILLMESLESGECKLRVLDGAGASFAPLDGLLLHDNAQGCFAPVPVDLDGDGTPGLICGLLPNNARASSELISVMDNGEIADSWFMSGRIQIPIQLLDVNDDGRLDLFAEDNQGWSAAWDLGGDAVSYASLLGGPLHDSNFLQPVTEDALPKVLSGSLLLPELFQIDSVGLVHGHLVSGALELTSSFDLSGNLLVGPQATLSFAEGASGTVSLETLDLYGKLSMKGAVQVLGELPMQRTDESLLFSVLPIVAHKGAVWDFETCTFGEADAPLVIGSDQTLLMKNCWLLDQGVVLTGANGELESCLFKGMDTGLFLDASSIALLKDCIFSSVVQTAVDNQGGRVMITNGLFLTNEMALRHGQAAETVVDSTHFQGNIRDVLATDEPESLSLDHCDFVQTWSVGVTNLGSGTINARTCYWELVEPTLGEVSRESELVLPVKPMFLPAAVFDCDPGPMVDGDEPLEWTPVEYTIEGIPVDLQYCVYRSQDPYDVVRPENLMIVTENSWWTDTDPPSRAFYQITTTFGKPVP